MSDKAMVGGLVLAGFLIICFALGMHFAPWIGWIVFGCGTFILGFLGAIRGN